MAPKNVQQQKNQANETQNEWKKIEEVSRFDRREKFIFDDLIKRRKFVQISLHLPKLFLKSVFSFFVFFFFSTFFLRFHNCFSVVYIDYIFLLLILTDCLQLFFFCPIWKAYFWPPFFFLSVSRFHSLGSFSGKFIRLLKYNMRIFRVIKKVYCFVWRLITTHSTGFSFQFYHFGR